jgi:hypothetical protein
MLELQGVVIALFEVALWFMISNMIRRTSHSLSKMNTFTYYWFTFIVLTGFWEVIYLSNYKYITTELAQPLVDNNTHVWTTKYSVSYVLPWKFSEIFYAEYGAHADREYMSQSDGWSHLIEGSHCTYCSLFCLIALSVALWKGVNGHHYLIALIFAMGNQFMNSLLYMGEYSIQVNDPTSPNFNRPDFPLGKCMSRRPFMWINYLWLVCPLVITWIHWRKSFSSEQLPPPYQPPSEAPPPTYQTKNSSYGIPINGSR